MNATVSNGLTFSGSCPSWMINANDFHYNKYQLEWSTGRHETHDAWISWYYYNLIHIPNYENQAILFWTHISIP